MKTTFKFIIAAMAAIPVFASCQKEMNIETAYNTNDAVRVISAQFDNSTKASLNNLKPSFENGDKIRVSNTVKSEECTVTVSGSTVSFTTTLSGALTAIYPAAAAVLSSNTDNAPIATSNNIKVLTSQSGSVKDAIIAKATVAAGENTAIFSGQTAVFRITPGAGDNTKYVEVITAGPAIANTTTTEHPKKNKIHVETTTTTAANEVFVSVLVPTGLKLRDLSFADGSNIKTVNDATKGATPIEVNTIYTIKGDSGWDEPYVEINGLKWATKNIGATETNPNGKYFAWGDTHGQEAATSGEHAFDTKPFDWTNAPFNNGASYDATYFASVKDTECPGGILALKNDAANANWGGSWRMPTKEEFDALVIKKLSFSSGCYFGDSDENKIFLPAAGYGIGTDLYFANEGCLYWSSSLRTEQPDKAYGLSLGGINEGAFDFDRFFGQSVRALSD